VKRLLLADGWWLLAVAAVAAFTAFVLNLPLQLLLFVLSRLLLQFAGPPLDQS